MSWSFVAHRGSATNKTSGTTLSVAPTANLAVGAIVVVRCASDNIGTTSVANTTEHSLSDSRGNAWTKLREFRRSSGAAADGVTASLWAARIVTQIGTGDSITLTLSSAVVAKCMAVEEFAAASDKTFSVAAVKSTYSNTQPTVSISNLPSAERLWLGHVGAEGPNGDSYTQDSDYSNNTSVGTTGGTATTNVYSRFGSRVATITGDTFAPTLGANRNNCALLVALDEVDASVVVTPSAAGSRTVALIGSVILGSLIVTAATASARATAIAPAAELGSVTVMPAAAVSRALAIAPAVQLGSLALTPANAAARALAVGPTVEIGGGGTSASPAFAASRATAIAPAVQLGSVTVTPPNAAARVLAIWPAVELGSITMTPAATVARALAVAPGVQLGSVTATPATAAARALAVGPSVQISGGLSLTPAAASARALATTPSLWIRPMEGRLVVTARAQGRSFVATATSRIWTSPRRDRRWS